MAVMIGIKKFVALAADALDTDRSTISDWHDTYDRKSLDGPIDDTRPRRPL